MANTISLKQLSEAMRLGNLGKQIVLKSEKAFGKLRFLDSEKADNEDYFNKKSMRDTQVRREYRKRKKTDVAVDDIFMLDIMREGMKNGNTHLL